MFISSICIKNYRCFEDISVKFIEGVNVIIGENNAGKTVLLKALGLVFNSNARKKLAKYDFYQGIENFEEPPSIIVQVTLQSSGENDTDADKALVATWLTNLNAPWEATLTYKYFLPEKEIDTFKGRLDKSSDMDKFWEVVEQFLPKYIYRIYAGNPSALIRVEPEWLNKFDYHFLDAIRDVESELFLGSNPLLKTMLYDVLDSNLNDDDEGEKEKLKRKATFKDLSKPIRKDILKRLDYKSLFKLVKETGAKDGGEPSLESEIDEQDIIAALRLFIQKSQFKIPANYNGLGYNNLIYISLVLSHLDLKTNIKQHGQNATMFPLLLIEEPEAHLHPALQYKLLKYINNRVTKEHKSRQIFLTSHSTHITSACHLDQIICMSIIGNSIAVSYPGKAFGDDADSKKSKKYVERYLDATKSNMLFSKSVIFVEGLSEQILLPCFAEYLKLSLEDNHVAVIGVGGSTFKHFLPIFGAGHSDEFKMEYCLPRKIACIIDADPIKKMKNTENSRWKACYPYELNFDEATYEYEKQASVVDDTINMCSSISDNVKVCVGKKTLEYDLALENALSPLLITTSCTHEDKLEEFIQTPSQEIDVFENKINYENTKQALNSIEDETEREKLRYATYYFLSISRKGEHAFDLERKLRENLKDNSEDFKVPDYIREAIEWVCPVKSEDIT
jgi:putative ATP-dependent endonuclease of OLD family